MTWITLTGVGVEVAAGGTSAANPQLQFFENFPGHLGAGTIDESGGEGILSIHAVNLPLSISLNNAAVIITWTSAVNSTKSQYWHFGLYSLTGSTLSLENSGSGSITYGDATGSSWFNVSTFSKTQNITPGAWYFAFLNRSSGHAVGDRWYGNSSINPANAIPGGFLMGRVTASTGAMPASIATSALDITGSDAIRQPYIIITA